VPLSLYNTLTRRKEPFVPQDPQRVTMYVCGPTVYSYAHIGNARPAVVFDVLFRLLRLRFPNVVYARNITDVDDKINKAAAEEGVPIAAVTEKFAPIYRDDMSALGVLPPTIEPKVTEHLPQIVRMIETLVAGGFAYAADGHVLFHVPAFKDYGALSRRDRDELIAGARVEVAPYKKDPADFVLWKPSVATQPGWESPWGRGRPGWHIECSAMIETHLGRTIDIHGGGQDLIFPHHENEIAQGTCAHGGALYARYWMHNGFLNVDAEKMSKSIGNVLRVHDLLTKAAGETIRLVLLSAHYRQPLDWTDESLDQAKRNLDRLYGALRRVADVPAAAAKPDESVFAALEDDLNTPQAIAGLFALARELNVAEGRDVQAALKGKLVASGALLGLLEAEPEGWFAGQSNEGDTAAIESLIAARNAARKAKNFTEADRIRDQLAAMGVAIEDGPQGTRWKRA
jgi:cysteinyl-tRNA synthetase